MNFIAFGIFQLASVLSWHFLSKDVCLHFFFLRWQNKKRLLQGVLVALTFGLSHEKDIIWLRDASSQWRDRIVLETFTDEQCVQK